MAIYSVRNLLQGSFKGAEFSFKDSRTVGGRNTATHEFVNKDRRFVEDLGRYQDVFRLTGIVTGKTSSEFTQRKEALKSALDSEGDGILVHPTLGRQNVTSIRYTLIENDNELNLATFNMNFERSTDNIFPQIGGDASGSVVKIAEQLIAAVDNLVAGNFGVNINFPFNFNDARVQLNSVADFFERNSSIFGDENSISKFFEDLTDFRRDIVNDIQEPNDLARDITELFSSLNAIPNEPQQSFDTMTSYFDYGNDLEPVSELTVQREEQIKNRQLIQNQMQITSLAFSYISASLIEYTNSQQLDDNFSVLNEQYNKILDLTELDDETLDSLDNVRDSFRVFTESQKVQVFRLTDIMTNVVPITVLTYQYYGNIDNRRNIIDLNPGLQGAFFEGDIRILTA